jgi:hypothetical protein
MLGCSHPQVPTNSPRKRRRRSIGSYLAALNLLLLLLMSLFSHWGLIISCSGEEIMAFLFIPPPFFAIGSPCPGEPEKEVTKIVESGNAIGMTGVEIDAGSAAARVRGIQ